MCSNLNKQTKNTTYFFFSMYYVYSSLLPSHPTVSKSFPRDIFIIIINFITCFATTEILHLVYIQVSSHLLYPTLYIQIALTLSFLSLNETLFSLNRQEDEAELQLRTSTISSLRLRSSSHVFFFSLLFSLFFIVSFLSCGTCLFIYVLDYIFGLKNDLTPFFFYFSFYTTLSLIKNFVLKTIISR